MTIEQKKEQYTDFLLSKVRVAEKHGIRIDPSRLHPSTKPHQSKIICWGLEIGAALIAPDCGTGKTHMGIETCRILKEDFGGKALIVTELGASETFVNPDPAVGEGARLGIPLAYVTSTDEAMASPCDIVVTNYERVRDGRFDFSAFTVVWLDEGNYVKNMASDTTNALAKQLKNVKYKYIATATPSPNEVLELVNYAHVLGIADRGQILTQFFQRNSTKAGELTLHPQHEADFWLWVHSWMVAIEFPSDLGFSDEGYELPELRVHWIEVKMDKPIEAGIEKNGQARLVADTGGNDLPMNAKLKKASIDVRLAKSMEIIGNNPDDHFIIWHHLNDEKAALNKVFKGDNYAALYGSMKESDRERIVVDFTKGDLKYLATKPEISGVGCNFQRHCSKAILMGINNDFNLLYQMLKRIYRPFCKGGAVDFYILYLPEEYTIVKNLKEKWELHNEQRTWLRSLTQKHGLDHTSMVQERKRTFKIDRKEYAGQNYRLVSTDCTYEWMDVPDDSIHLINSSFPFGTHYEYTNYYNDYGHNIDNRQFARQLDFLLPELLRTMAPGRIVAVHLKNLPRYISALNPDYVQIENVVEFMSWGPLDKNGKPVSRRNGSEWLRWRRDINAMGYRDEWRELNSADFGAYTSRNRLFGCFAKGDLPIVWPTPTHAKNPKKEGLFGAGLKKWMPVKDVLDFEDEGISIFKRKKPLSPRTLERIYAGLIKYVAGGKEAFLSTYNGGKPDTRNTDLDGPCRSVLTANTHAKIQCSFIQKYYSGRPEGKVIPVTGPAGTVTTVGGQTLVQPFFLVNYNHSSECADINNACPTLLTRDKLGLVNTAFLAKYYGNGDNIQSVDEPAGTLTTKDRFTKAQVVWLDKNYNGPYNHQSVDRPAGTVMTNDKHQKVHVKPFILNPNYGNIGKDISEPAPPLLASRRHYYIVNPSHGGHTMSTEVPCPVIVARQDKSPLYLMQVDNTPMMVFDAPLFLDDEDWQFLITGEGESSIRVKIIEFMFLYNISDVKMRMLKVDELLPIQGFPRDYVLVGNQSDQKKFIGNSVVPKVVKDWYEAMGLKLDDLQDAA
ncbi:DNA cytosine methyltransferase [Parapedobacter soli]|uniref:DNA cytosine methyltransferase n=1 Tax=Parapedobacter soli TaxID=416955 RepID=UPI0021C5B32B|nr:DNA cytosine methyltransferase [Parapedobacter soli]